MKTVKEEMLGLLIQNGMFEDQASEVMEIAISKMDTMKDNWNKDAGSYPSIVIKMTWRNVKAHALDWINANQPEAWYKPIFEQ